MITSRVVDEDWLVQEADAAETSLVEGCEEPRDVTREVVVGLSGRRVVEGDVAGWWEKVMEMSRKTRRLCNTKLEG